MLDNVASDEIKLASVDSRVKFSEVCGLLEKLQKKSSTDGKKEIFKDFLTKWRNVTGGIDGTNSDHQNGASFYPVMRLLLPKLDLDRPAYGIKENTLARHYIDILGLGKDSPDAQKLLNFRSPGALKGSTDSSGDFAAVAYHVLQHRLPEKGNLTVREINSTLDSIAIGNATKSKDAVKTGLTKLMHSLGPIESKWVMRIILKEIRIGMSENSIFAAFHPDADQLFNVSSNLKRVCDDLRDPKVSLGEIEIKLFTPFRPMLADRILAQKVCQSISSQSFYVETKMDGERMQLHKDGSEFRYFSRSSKDYTSSFGKNYISGTFTPFIADAFKPHVNSCILDGEMMVFSTELQQFVTKGQNVDVKKLPSTKEASQSNETTSSNSKQQLRHSGATLNQPKDGLRLADDPKNGLVQCYVVFDILLLNQKVLSAKPLHERLNLLKDIFVPSSERIRYVEQSLISTQDDVLNALNSAIENREEGIIVKHPDSIYKPDKRKDSGWFKIKPDYEQNVMSDLDLVIVGGYYGSGRRSNIISHFLLAVSDNSISKTDRNYYTFAKIGSGYTALELKSMLEKLDPNWTKVKPENIRCSNEKAQVWVKPEDSVVVCVRAAELIVSEKYHCGFTLRFPRLESIRDDKDYSSILTEGELKDLWNTYQGKLATKLSTGDSMPPPKKKQRVVTRKINQPITIDDRFRATDLSKIRVKSSLFEDRQFCVMSVPEDRTRKEFETSIVSNGGKIVQNANKETFCVLTDKVNIRVKNLIKADICDVVHIEWLEKCVEGGKMSMWQPEEVFHVCEQSRSLFEKEFGDDFKTRLKQC